MVLPQSAPLPRRTPLTPHEAPGIPTKPPNCHRLLHVTAGHEFDQKHFAATERVRSVATGKVVGFDAFSGRTLSDGVVFQTAFAFKGGILLTRVHTVGGTPTRYAGRVIGGTGAYRGATGTVSGRAVNREDTRLTIRYSS